jgi:hypothetical protein
MAEYMVKYLLRGNGASKDVILQCIDTLESEVSDVANKLLQDYGVPPASRPDNIWSKIRAYTSRRTAVTLGLDPEREQDLPAVVDLSSLAFDHSPTYVCRTIYVHESLLQW